MSVLNQILKQVGVVLVGLVLAGVMVGLGVWQLSVYHAQGREEAVKRAAQPAVSVTTVARPGQQVGDDAYGRKVRFTGHYDKSLQTFIAVGGDSGRYRVLTGLRLSTGGVLPVVRGVVNGRTAPMPPSGTVTQTGILLPSQGTDPRADPSAEPTTFALSSLAQQWKETLVNGYATLSAPYAKAQSLQPAVAALPSSHGRIRNGFYALQWWVFAAFAVGMGIRMARDIGRAGGDGPALMGGDPAPSHEPGARLRTPVNVNNQAHHDALGEAEPDKAEPDKAEPDKAEPDKAEPDKTEPDKTEPDKTEPDKTEPDKTEPDKAEPDKTQADESGGRTPQTSP